MLEPLDVAVNARGHARQSRLAHLTADDVHHRSVDIAHGIDVDVWLNGMLEEGGLGRVLDDPPKGGFDPVLEVVVDLVGHKGRHERREVKLEVEDVAWERIGDFERVEMEVAEVWNVVDVVEINPDVLNPWGIGRDKRRHVVVIVVIVVFNVVVNVHHFET